MIVTDPFERVARQLLKSLGYPQVPVLVTPNPVIYLSEDEIHRRIDVLLAPLAASLSGAGTERA